VCHSLLIQSRLTHVCGILKHICDIRVMHMRDILMYMCVIYMCVIRVILVCDILICMCVILYVIRMCDMTHPDDSQYYGQHKLGESRLIHNV